MTASSPAPRRTPRGGHRPQRRRHRRPGREAQQRRERRRPGRGRRSPAASRPAPSSSPALANLAIAVAKLIGGLISHSSAMLSEAAHSVADTVTEVFLFVALKRGQKPPDEKHPFGYGRETYFWAFIASLTTFLVGAGFSFYQGITTIIERRGPGRPADLLHRPGGLVRPRGRSPCSRPSARCAARPASGASRPRQYLRRTTDTTVKAVTFEDTAALVGLVLAALGLFLEQLTGDPLWDGVAAIAIGLLLLVVAFVLARANMSLLIGQSASPRIEAGAQGGDRRAGPRRRRPVPAHLGDRPRAAPGRRQGRLRRHVHGRPTSSGSPTRRSGGWSPGTRASGTSSSTPPPGDGRARAEAHRPDDRQLSRRNA